MRAVELSLLRHCPVRCVYCPQELLKRATTGLPPKMTLDELKAIVGNVHEGRHAVEIIFAGFTEPLLHHRALSFIEAACTDRRVRHVKLYSTGEGLTPERIQQLARYPQIEISWHTAMNRDLMPYGRGRFWKLFEEIVDALPHSQFSAVRSRHSLAERKQLRKVMKGLRFRWGREVTRAANVQRSTNQTVPEPLACAVTCKKVSNRKMPVVVPGGTTVACCNDYGLDLVIGNLAKQPWSQLDYGRVEALQAKPVGAICHTACHYAKPANA